MSAAHSHAHRQHYTPLAEPADSGSDNTDHSFHARAALAAVYILASIVLGAYLTGAIQ